MALTNIKYLFLLIGVILTDSGFGQNTFPATGSTILNSGTDNNLILNDSRAGTNWNYIEWLFADGSRDWVLGRKVNTGSFTLWRTGLNDVVTVDNDGNFGIGTTNPQAKLDVNGKIAVNGVDVISNGGHDVYANLRVLRNASAVYPDGMYIGYAGSGGPLRFFSNSGTTEFMTLTTNGRLGIGTTSPQWQLDVDNGIAVRGQLIIDSGPNEIRIGDLASGDGFRDKLQFWTRDQNRMTLDENGNLGIGTADPNEKLTVHGTIYGKEVKVDLSVPGPDYVFEPDYDLAPLEEIESYINKNKHLPEVPTAAEMRENGIRLGEMNMILLKKIEELTLYIIDLKKENAELREDFDSKMESLEKMLSRNR